MRKPFWKIAAAAVVVGCTVLTACSQATDAGQRLFILWDPGLQLPAICYRLDPDWEGKGQIGWNMRSDNKFMASTILSSPKRHLLLQTLGPMFMVSEVLTPQRMAEFQNPNVLAQNFAAEFNRTVIEPGLSNFVATGGRFSQEVPPLTQLLAASYRQGATISTVSAFSFEGTFTCLYGGVQCEAKYTASFAVSISAVPNPRIPKICNFVRVSPVLAIAPPGKLSEAFRDGGRMFASAFINRHWLNRRDGMLNALVQGTIQGRNAGWRVWQQSQAETAETLDRIRKMRSEQIREVVTVDNPFEPGTTVERPAFFKNSWINSRQDAMLLSDSSLEPNTIRVLMEQGEWLPAN
ncbi:MAG: hypothetical protein J5985_04365 [Kiritimatiellae bacterium]|nr:hypothetical protein [Kiritimatiellia bacterium]